MSAAPPVATTVRPHPRRDSRRGDGPGEGVGPPSEDLLHDQAPFGVAGPEVGEQSLERVAALEKRLELTRGVPGRVAMDAHVSVGLDANEDVESLAARVLLTVALESLERPIQVLPFVRRNERLGQARIGDERWRGGHQNFWPQTRWPTMIAASKATTKRVNTMKNAVAGLAASAVHPPKASMG